MMAVTPHAYGLLLESLVEGRINVRSDPMYAMLVTSTYVFNQNTHKFKSVVTGEILASGYVAGGKQVTGLTPSYSGTTKSLTMPAGNLSWPSITFSDVIGAVLYMAPATFGDAVKPLVAFMDFGGAQSRTDQAFFVNWPPSIITLGPVV